MDVVGGVCVVKRLSVCRTPAAPAGVSFVLCFKHSVGRSFHSGVSGVAGWRRTNSFSLQ